ncbi:kinase-like domain-containing protein [Obelidium mucronatum]|nr:kinase-like domain-containing protein [Obelidium mucronatum]
MQDSSHHNFDRNSDATGSTDLAGDKKDRIDHHRVEDVSDLERKYRIGRKLGQGSFGTVYLVQEKESGLAFACKSLKKKQGSIKNYEQLQREVSIMKLIQHKSIIKLFEVYETPKQIFLVMEHCGGGELDERFRRCSEGDIRVIVRRLADAVGYLHAHGIVHRDIKPANILLSSSDPFDKLNIKVSDFGLATWVNSCTMMENVVGTPLYMAPEIIQSLPYSAQCDIWSIGVMTYMLLCGFSKEVQHMFQKMVVEGKIVYPQEYWKTIAPGARSLCDSMLRVDPAKRISAKEIISHPWIKGETGSKGMGQTNVLDMMKSYSAHLKFQKVLRIVLCAIRFMYPIRKRASLKAASSTGRTSQGVAPPAPAAPTTSLSTSVKRRAGSVALASTKPNGQGVLLNSYSQVPRGSTGPTPSYTLATLTSAPSHDTISNTGPNRSLGTSFESIGNAAATTTSTSTIFDSRMFTDAADTSSKLLPMDPSTITSPSARNKIIGGGGGSSSDLLGDMGGAGSTVGTTAGITANRIKTRNRQSLDMAAAAPTTTTTTTTTATTASSLQLKNNNNRHTTTELSSPMSLSKIAAQERSTSSALKRPQFSTSRTKVTLTNVTAALANNNNTSSSSSASASAHTNNASNTAGTTTIGLATSNNTNTSSSSSRHGGEKAHSVIYTKDDPDKSSSYDIKKLTQSSTSSLTKYNAKTHRRTSMEPPQQKNGRASSNKNINTLSGVPSHSLNYREERIVNGGGGGRISVPTSTAAADAFTILHNSTPSLPKIGGDISSIVAKAHKKVK